LRRVDYDSSSNLLKIEGGALNGNILKALKDLKPAGFENGMAIVHGRCPAVGVSAYLMGGGIGFNMNSFGAGCDRVDKVEVALADGRVVTASEDNTDKDLFWAVRGGGGGNLGIATCWWLRPFPVNQAAGFVASWQAGNDPGALQAPFTTIVRVLENSPPELGAQVSLSASKGKPWPTSIRLVGQFLGTWDEFKRRCPGLLEGAAQCAHVEGAYWKIQEFLDVEAIPNRYLETSLFTGPLTDDAIGTLFKKFGTWPGTTSAARITFFRTGGEMNKVKKPGETAFVHRRSEWLADTDIDWDDRDTDQDVYNSLRWQRDVHAELDQAFAGQGSYQNFPDPGLANHGIAYWGANLKRLVEVKLQYDPTFVFTPPQNQEIAG
jgi:FAD/FMN-containing dehydrogenase